MHKNAAEVPAHRHALIRCCIDYYTEFQDLIGELALRALTNYLQSTIAGNCTEVEQIVQTFPGGFAAVVCLTDRRELDSCFGMWEQRLQEFAGKQNIPYVLSLSIGVYDGVEALKPSEEILQKTAYAQRFGRIFSNPSVRYYDSNALDKLLNQRYLELGMRTALHEHQFEVYLQPQYRLCDKSLAGAEALVRWKHPELGLLPPDAFIPLFEQNLFVLRLDFYMLEECCKLISFWRRSYRRIPPVSVNFSRLHASTSDFARRFLEVTDRYGVGPEDLYIEWTESAFSAESAQIGRIAEELRAKGFRIAMDDFGSGYSSLNELTDMPVDILKLDKGFLRFEQQDEKREYLLANVIKVARYLQYELVMEGVENGWQLDLVRNAGCECVQGFLFSPPMPVPEFEKKFLSPANLREVMPLDRP